MKLLTHMRQIIESMSELLIAILFLTAALVSLNLDDFRCRTKRPASAEIFLDTLAGTAVAANSFGFSGMSRGFTNQSFVYTSPEFKRLRLNLGCSGKNSQGDQQAGLEYKATYASFGVQYIKFGEKGYIPNSIVNDDAVRWYALLEANAWSVSGSIEALIS